MIVDFGKFKGKDITEVPFNYIEWAKDNLSQEDKKQIFIQEYERRLTPVQEYNKLIFGKDQTERIVNVSIKDGMLHTYMYKDGNLVSEVETYSPWYLSKDYVKGCEKLKGDQFYKYLVEVDDIFEYNAYAEEWSWSRWFPRKLTEGHLLRNGVTYYKGMTPDDLAIMSIDIETLTFSPDDPEALIPLLSTTFRKNGKVTKKLFDFVSYDWNDKEMLKDAYKYVQEMNPDIILGHNIFSFDLPYLDKIEPMMIGRDGSRIEFDNKASKFRKDGSQKYDYYNATIFGREIVDTFFLSMKYDVSRDFTSYGLKSLEKELKLVDENRIDWDFDKYPVRKILEELQNGNDKLWEDFKVYCQDDADSPIQIFDIMAPSFFYLNQSVPKTFQQIINEATGGQLDSFMIRAYLQDGYSQPKSDKTEKFEGAISMGNPGVYENVRKVDVASLYPSIMLEYNIYDKKKDPKRLMLKSLEYFREERLKNKKLGADGSKYHQDLSDAQKIVINSLYGFMGANFLLYNYIEGAGLVTEHGREILQKGVEWATGRRLKKQIKKIINKGKENEKIQYEWVLGEEVTNPDHKGFEIVNTDTDSFSYCGSNADFEQEIEDLNSIYPDMIRWEDDGVFDKVIVIAAKNYILKKNKAYCKPKELDINGEPQIKIKGSSITDQKKETAVREFAEKLINSLLKKEPEDKQVELYETYCLEALDIQDINRWTTKKTITDKLLSGTRVNETKPQEAIKEAIDAGVIDAVQEGDKIWLYWAVSEPIHLYVKGEPQYLKKTGEPKMVENSVLRFPELWNGDEDKWHYVERVYQTLEILENIIDIKKFPKYFLKKQRDLLLDKKT